MDPDRIWIVDRVAESPPPLRDAVIRAWDATPGFSGAERCARAALRILTGAERIAASRAGAIQLLAADALLTLACEHAAEHEPERLAQFARSVGPAGAFTAG